MKIKIPIVCAWIISFYSCAVQSQPGVYSEDIGHYWEVYEALEHANTYEDSIKLVQTLYLDRAGEGLQKFMGKRDLKAEYYVANFRRYPAFWASLRQSTDRIPQYTATIEAVFDRYRQAFPDFEEPAVCLAIGVMSTGGTIDKGWILLGAEIVLADSTVEKSELNEWLKSVTPEKVQVAEFVAHETVHLLQPRGFAYFWGTRRHRLLTQSIHEGAADFIAKTVAGSTINKNIYDYGEQHEAVLWEAFQKEMLGNDISRWLYNGNSTSGRPGDLGYFVGYKICESYYNHAPDKAKALQEIISIKNYKRFVKKSGYDPR